MLFPHRPALRKTWHAAGSIGLAAVCLCSGSFAEDAASNINQLRLNLTSPQDFQVVQRNSKSAGRLVIAGVFTGDKKDVEMPDRLEVRLAGTPSFGVLPQGWQPLACDPRVSAFRGEVNAPAGGWFSVEVRAFLRGEQVANETVGHVGVGEVFVIAGQSNAANSGEEKNTTRSGLVSAFDGAGWRLAADPEPGASGAKGSFLPMFGDEIVERFRVPVGLVAMGIGSTSVREWLPTGTQFTNLPSRTINVVTVGPGTWASTGKIFDNFTRRMQQFGPQGFRAVLWHQGESDAHQADPKRTLPGTLYREDLEKLIGSTRQVCGWDMPWFVAQASYHGPADTHSDEIRGAQKAVADDGFALPGPDTDTLVGLMREKLGAGIHLSDEGLKAHARLWVEKVAPWLERQLGP